MSLKEGYRAEVMSLTYSRGRIIETDGFNVSRSW